MPRRPLPASVGAAFGWSRDASIGWRAVFVAALGMAVPVVAGMALGRAEAGFTIGLGAMLLAGGPTAGSGETPSPGSAVVPAVLAVGASTAIAGTPWQAAAMVALAAVAATVSGYSRPVGVAAIRFIVYFVLGLGLIAGATGHHGAAALLFGLGALWNVAIRVALGRGSQAAPAIPARSPTSAQRRAYFRRTLRQLDGWQFTIRIATGLALASAIAAAWPGHRGGWIVLTVALLTQRPLEHLPIKAVQRTLGTALGVGLTWLVLALAATSLARAIVICLLATAVPLARARSYLAYAVLATPVILLVIDFGRPVTTALLADRLIATLAGAAIVIALNVALDRALPAKDDGKATGTNPVHRP